MARRGTNPPPHGRSLQTHPSGASGKPPIFGAFTTVRTFARVSDHTFQHMIISTLSSDPATAMELGRRIAATEHCRRQPRQRGLGAMFGRFFARHPAAKLVRAHA